MKRLNPIDFMFKDEAEFDVQTPVIGLLYEQIVDNKKKEKEILRQLDKAPNPRDILLHKKFDKLTDFNRKRIGDNNNNDDDATTNNNNISGNLFPPTPEFRGIPPTPPITPGTPRTSLSSMQKFLLQPGGNEKIAEAIAVNSNNKPTIKKIIFSDAITKILPSLTADANTIEEEPSATSSFVDDFSETDDSISEIQINMSELNDGNHPFNLEFFSGGEKNEEKLFKNVAKNVGIINRSNQKFLEFLTSKFGTNLLMKNKIQIHLETGQIFHNNKITGGSL